MHPLSLAFLTVADVGPVEAVHVAAETGYQKIGFRRHDNGMRIDLK